MTTRHQVAPGFLLIALGSACGSSDAILGRGRAFEPQADAQGADQGADGEGGPPETLLLPEAATAVPEAATAGGALAGEWGPCPAPWVPDAAPVDSSTPCTTGPGGFGMGNFREAPDGGLECLFGLADSGDFECESEFTESCGGTMYRIACACPNGTCACFGPSSTHVIDFPVCPDCLMQPSTLAVACGFPH